MVYANTISGELINQMVPLNECIQISIVFGIFFCCKTKLNLTDTQLFACLNVPVYPRSNTILMVSPKKVVH